MNPFSQRGSNPHGGITLSSGGLRRSSLVLGLLVFALGLPWTHSLLPCAQGAESLAKHAPTSARTRNPWSFRPIQRPTLPAVQRTNWVVSPIDTFILATLERAGLAPAPAADRRTLLRRASFDLTGLPPTPEEVETFVFDHQPDAFARRIDALLESPHYGEKWGRHWLDVARYADSNGLDENVAHGNAWRYRDYVVHAFNQDKPFDQFVLEQLAGDLLPDTGDWRQRNERLTATGFLSLGAKVLAEPDPMKMEMDIIDEQIDTTGRVFLGLTLGCARCHEHKFDPIPTEDYYAMAAIFKGTRTMNHFKIVAEWHEAGVATPAEKTARAAYDRAVSETKATIQALNDTGIRNARAEAQRRAADYLAAALALPPTPSTNDLAAAAAMHNLQPALLERCFDLVNRTNSPALFHRWHTARRAGAPDLKTTIEHYRNVFSAALAPASRTNAPGSSALAGDAEPSPMSAIADIAAARQALDDPKGFLALPDKPEGLFPTNIVQQLAVARQSLAQLEQQAVEVPSAMGVTDRTNIVQGLPVHLRGSHLNLGDVVPRGVPRALGTTTPAPKFQENQSGRTELARWLVHPDHPLTARVLVNRLWRWHFGQGLVASTENFGQLGEQPSHPELLDYLAWQLQQQGWSLKRMHRLIMHSATYQQASARDDLGRQEAARIDPGNRLLSTFSVRRLEAEELRDALLAVSGRLDRSIGGKTIPVKNREFVFNHTSKDATTYESLRRAIYLPIIRNNVYDLFSQFDFPDPAVPTGNRNETIVAPQALLVMNADWVWQAAAALAAGLPSEITTTAARIDRLYRLAYGRPATPAEITRAEQFLRQWTGCSEPAPSASVAVPQTDAWTALSHAVLAANEFCYLH